MTVNMGQFDRIARFLVGIGLLAWALGLIPGAGASAWGWIGLIPLATSLLGSCPVYSLLGVDTCGRKA